MDKILILYYSRTGVTKKLAEAIKQQLNPVCAGRCDIEEVISVKKRTGVIGYVFCGKEATQKTLAEIKPITKNPRGYDIVIIGTPVWAWNISSPIRTILENNKGRFKKIAAFCTMGGDAGKTFAEIEKICGSKLIATLSLKTNDVLAGNFKEKVESYCRALPKLSCPS